MNIGPAVLQVEDGIGHRLAIAVGEQRARVAAGDLAEVGRIGVEQAVHDRRAARVRQKLRLVADEAAGGRMEHDALAANAGGAHVAHFGAALRELLHHDAGIFLVDVDDHFLDGLQLLAGFLVGLEHHARAADGQLEALAAHGFDQDAELQFATARHFEGVGFVHRCRDLQRDVAFRLAQQAVADDAGLHLVAFLAGQRPVVDAEGHGQRRRIDGLGVDRLGHAWGRRSCRRPSPW